MSNENGNQTVVNREVENIHRVHAHRCENCAKNGMETVWLHGDEKGGDIAAHKCPQCGTVEWKKFLVRPSKLPSQVQQAASAITSETILGYVAILVGIILLVALVSSLFREEKKIA